MVAPNLFRNRTELGEADAETGQPACAVAHLLPVRLPPRVAVLLEQVEDLGLCHGTSLLSTAGSRTSQKRPRGLSEDAAPAGARRGPKEGTRDGPRRSVFSARAARVSLSRRFGERGAPPSASEDLIVAAKESNLQNADQEVRLARRPPASASVFWCQSADNPLLMSSVAGFHPCPPVSVSVSVSACHP